MRRRISGYINGEPFIVTCDDSATHKMVNFLRTMNCGWIKVEFVEEITPFVKEESNSVNAKTSYGECAGGGMSKANNQCFVPRHIRDNPYITAEYKRYIEDCKGANFEDYESDVFSYSRKWLYGDWGKDASVIGLDETTNMTKKNWEALMSKNINYGIRNLKKCKLGKKTTVELDDGRKGAATLNPADAPDPYVAFALAFTKAQFENSTAFYNFVDKLVKKNKRYGVFVKGKKLKPIGDNK